MSTDKKAAEERAALAEKLRDGTFIAGILALCVGIYLEFGIGYALMAFGVACLGTILLPVVMRNAP